MSLEVCGGKRAAMSNPWGPVAPRARTDAKVSLVEVYFCPMVNFPPDPSPQFPQV